MIYVILRSNREKVEFEDALALCPIEPDAIVNIIKQFENKMEILKKKDNMKNFVKNKK